SRNRKQFVDRLIPRPSFELQARLFSDADVRFYASTPRHKRNGQWQRPQLGERPHSCCLKFTRLKSRDSGDQAEVVVIATTPIAGYPPSAYFAVFDWKRIIGSSNRIRMIRDRGFEASPDEPKVCRKVLHAKALHRPLKIWSHDMEIVGLRALHDAHQF